MLKKNKVPHTRYVARSDHVDCAFTKIVLVQIQLIMQLLFLQSYSKYIFAQQAASTHLSNLVLFAWYFKLQSLITEIICG